MNDFSRAPRVLVVEDDEDIAQALQRSLRMEGYEVRAAADGRSALEHGRSFAPDLVILDLGLPEIDGLEVARALRAEDDVPILILTARDALDSRVEGLDAGADDYLVKPFDFGELVARIRALQRRPRNVDGPVIARGLLRLDPVRHEIAVSDAALNLTSTEYNILELLMRRSPAVVDRKAIAEHAWRDETVPMGSNAIDVQLSRLRAKIANTQVRIVTVRGSGYRLEEA